MPKETKANKAETEKRVTTVVDLLLDGLRRHEIYRFVSENEAKGNLNWNVTTRQIDEYIAKASEIIRNYESDKREDKIKKAEQRLEKLLSRAISNKDLRLARLIIADIRTLFGLDAPSKFEGTLAGDIRSLDELVEERERERGLTDKRRDRDREKVR